MVSSTVYCSILVRLHSKYVTTRDNHVDVHDGLELNVCDIRYVCDVRDDLDDLDDCDDLDVCDDPDGRGFCLCWP
jgi:hypothetical protein